MPGHPTAVDLSFVDNHGQEVDLQAVRGPARARRQHRQQLRLHAAVRRPAGAAREVPGAGPRWSSASPCDQFGHRSRATTRRSRVLPRQPRRHLPLSSKVDVNGSSTHPVFGSSKDRAGGLLGSRIQKWNFTKFLVRPTARTVKRATRPTSRPTAERHRRGDRRGARGSTRAPVTSRMLLAVPPRREASGSRRTAARQTSSACRFAQRRERLREQPRDVHLRDADLLGDLALRHAVEETGRQDPARATAVRRAAA